MTKEEWRKLEVGQILDYADYTMFLQVIQKHWTTDRDLYTCIILYSDNPHRIIGREWLAESYNSYTLRE